MGTMILAASSTSSSGSPAFTFIILAVLVGLFYVLIMRPQRNRQRKAMQTQSQVIPGQRIRTTAGLYGTIVSGDDRDIVVEIAPGVEVTMLRRAIMEVIPDDTMPSHEDIEPEEPGEPEDEYEAEAEPEAEAHEDASPPTDLKKKD
jgi:preprotein translocase subunit YajC